LLCAGDPGRLPAMARLTSTSVPATAGTLGVPAIIIIVPLP
jgi:hypothetical protein